MDDPTHENSPEDCYGLLVEMLDFHAPSRAEWRACFLRAERLPAQRVLLELAKAARQGTQADQLALYKAAHAVLPLHGADLVAITRLLLQFRPIPLEWADVLVAAFSEMSMKGASWTGEALDALREVADEPAMSVADHIRLRSLLYQLSDHGLHPAWLKGMIQKSLSP